MNNRELITFVESFSFFMPQILNHENESRIWDAFRHGEHRSPGVNLPAVFCYFVPYGFRFVGNPAMLEGYFAGFSFSI
jgi:hypothetical protein